MIDGILRHYNSNFKVFGFEVRDDYFEEELDNEN